MESDSRIYVAGHTGLVGSALTATLRHKGYTNLILRRMEELDLTDQDAVGRFFSEERPEYIFNAAAKVGGIVANNTLRADFIYINIMIQSNLIYNAWKHGSKKLLFLGSTCIYPKNAPQPLKEEYLLTSKLEYTNEPYAIAKITGIKMCESFNIQYNTNLLSVMPTNLYGPGDNYNLRESHVLPALLRKFHLGKCLEDGNWDAVRKDLDRYPVENVDGKAGDEMIIKILEKNGINIAGGPAGTPDAKVTVTVWGTGLPLREFMYSADMAEACVYVMENVDIKDIVSSGEERTVDNDHQPHFLNIGTGEEISIRDLAMKIKELTGFRGKVFFDTSKPDGTMRKATDVTRLHNLGYRHKTSLDEGLRKTYGLYSGIAV